MKPLPWLLLLWPIAHAAAGTPTDCLTQTPLPLTVRIGTTTPQHGLLIGGSAPALRIIDAGTGDTLWSAGAAASVSQRFAAMTAPFAGSFIALDTDGDGLHDRLYAGDLAGRLWRFDLFNGALAEAWASGGILADFSNDAGRGFLAPPDVSLATAPGLPPWFHIAIGTAAPGAVAANNRFYVLRDQAPYDIWTDQQYLDWQPLRERDLLRIDTAGEPAPTQIQAGWFIELEHGDVVSAALTVAGRSTFAITESSADMAAGCRSTFSVASVTLATGQLQRQAGGEWRRQLDAQLALDATFTLAVGDAGTGATSARCLFGTARAPECDVDLRPHRTWWRREDAE